MSEGAKAAGEDPVLNITFSLGDKTLHTIAIRVQRTLPLRIAKMYLMEIVPGDTKASLDLVLKAMGFK